MKTESFKHIVVSREGGVATMVLNRPERLNAMNRQMNEEVLSFFEGLAHDDETRVVVMRGEGRAFCAGGDLYEHNTFIGDEFETEMRVHTSMIFAMLNAPQPIICQLHGAAAGWGATFAFFSDIVIADENASISDPHVQLGLSTGDGAAIIWPQLMGYPRAKQFLMTGDPISGALAAQYGLVNEVHPSDTVPGRVNAIAKRIASQPQHAMRATKASINIPLKNLVQTMMDTCIAYEVATQKSTEHQNALTNFAHKRQRKPG
jgi:enoyl-CoA hydratase